MLAIPASNFKSESPSDNTGNKGIHRAPSIDHRQGARHRVWKAASCQRLSARNSNLLSVWKASETVVTVAGRSQAKFRVDVENLLEANMMSGRETAAEGAAEFSGAWSARL